MDLNQIAAMYDFTNKPVVITGGTGTLGREISSALVGCGASLAILTRNPALAEQRLKDRLEGDTGRAIFVYADVLDVDALKHAARVVRETFGGATCLVNAAGGNSPEATASPDHSFFDLLPDALRHVVDLNLLGTILPCQVFGKTMAEKGEGVILNITSMSALRPLTRVPAYSAAKAGVSNFTRWLAVHMAQEYSPRIRVNAIAPGFFLTEQNKFLLTDETTGELSSRGKVIVGHTPMGRFGDPADLLGPALWLLSPASAFVTGVVVPIDGGFSAYSGV